MLGFHCSVPFQAPMSNGCSLTSGHPMIARNDNTAAFWNLQWQLSYNVIKLCVCVCESGEQLKATVPVTNAKVSNPDHPAKTVTRASCRSTAV